MGAPSWIKDGIGISLVVLCGALYMTGVTKMSPTGNEGTQEVIEAATPTPVQPSASANI